MCGCVKVNERILEVIFIKRAVRSGNGVARIRLSRERERSAIPPPCAFAYERIGCEDLQLSEEFAARRQKSRWEDTPGDLFYRVMAQKVY